MQNTPLMKDKFTEKQRRLTKVRSDKCQLFMAESSIPNSGLGMYTAVDIKVGELAFYPEIVVSYFDNVMQYERHYFNNKAASDEWKNAFGNEVNENYCNCEGMPVLLSELLAEGRSRLLRPQRDHREPQGIPRHHGCLYCSLPRPSRRGQGADCHRRIRCARFRGRPADCSGTRHPIRAAPEGWQEPGAIGALPPRAASTELAQCPSCRRKMQRAAALSAY